MSGIDVHCHLEHMNAEKVIEEARTKMTYICTSVADPRDFDKMLEVAKKHKDFVKLEAGFHPSHFNDFSEIEILDYINKIRQNKEYIIAIGEVGLDYNWIKDEHDIERTKGIFLDFVKLAVELKLPLVIHSRSLFSETGEPIKSAIKDVLDLLDKFNLRVVLHCFSGSQTEMERAVALGYYISFATITCKSKKHQRLAKECPIENMLLETDSPWLDPHSSELINRPWKIDFTAGLIADIKEMDKDNLIEQTEENAKRVFDFSNTIV